MTLYLEAKAGNPAAILSLSDRTRKLALELDPDAFHSRALRWLDGNSSATERPVGAPILLDDTQGDGVFGWIRIGPSFFEGGEAAVNLQNSAVAVLLAMEETLGTQNDEGCAPRIFLPPSIDSASIVGSSHALPTLLAWLEYRLQLCPALHPRDAAGKWISTGGWNNEKKCFEGVDAEGLVRKAKLALSRGYDTLLVIKGQKGLDALPEGTSTIEIPPDPADAFMSILEQDGMRKCALRVSSSINHLITIKKLSLHRGSIARDKLLPPTVKYVATTEESIPPEARVLALSLLSFHATHKGNTDKAYRYMKEVRRLKPACRFNCEKSEQWITNEMPGEFAMVLTDLIRWDDEEWQKLHKELDTRIGDSKKWLISSQFNLLTLANSLSYRPLFRARLESGEKANASLSEAFNLRFLCDDNFREIFKSVFMRGRERDSSPMRQRNALAEVAWQARRTDNKLLTQKCLEACTNLKQLQDELNFTNDPRFDSLGDWTIATLEDRHDDADAILRKTTGNQCYLFPSYADRWLVERALAYRKETTAEAELTDISLNLLAFQVEIEKENQVGKVEKNNNEEWTPLLELLAQRTAAVLTLHERDTPPPRWDPDELRRHLAEPEKLQLWEPLIQFGTRVLGDGDPRGFIDRCLY